MTILDNRPVYALEVRTVDAGTPGRARRWLAWVLEAAAVPQDTIDAAVLTVSELTTNSFRHTDSERVLVGVELLATGVRLAVHDDGTRLDWQTGAGGLDEHGRGLTLVRALAARLEVDRHAHGTTVTAVIPYARTGA